MLNTINYNLKKPEATDYVNIQNFNDNADAIDTALNNLQGQINGAITTYFNSGIPTLENAPASSWTDDNAKNNHLGDLYYNVSNGYAYRFALVDSNYQWILNNDTDITTALTRIGNTAGLTTTSKTDLTSAVNEVNANIQRVIAPTAPTINASFIGQNYFDTTNKNIYIAITTGLGIYDWVKLNKDSSINLSTTTFNLGSQSDVTETIALNNNIFIGIYNGTTALVNGTNYTIAGNSVTINKAYLSTLNFGNTTLTYKFNSGTDQSLIVTLKGIYPSSATFSKANPVDINVKLDGSKLASIYNNTYKLNYGTDDVTSVNGRTLLKGYLTTLAIGTYTIIFNYSDSTSDTLILNITA